MNNADDGTPLPVDEQLEAGRGWIQREARRLVAAVGVTDCYVTLEPMPKSFTDVLVLTMHGRRETLTIRQSELERLPNAHEVDRSLLMQRLREIVGRLLTPVS